MSEFKEILSVIFLLLGLLGIGILTFVSINVTSKPSTILNRIKEVTIFGWVIVALYVIAIVKLFMAW